MQPTHTPVLYVFSISHYCEKARWALDILKVPYELKTVAPGTHRKIARSHGLRRGSVPFLVTQSGVIQGSGNIIDWAARVSENQIALSSTSQPALKIEDRLDAVLGVHVRRWYYSEAILNQPAKVKPIFMRGISRWEQAKLVLSWPIITKVMTKGMDLGTAQGLESKKKVLQELEWLESLLEGTHTYLVGDCLSRADITAASLLAPLVRPLEHPYADLISLPPVLASDVMAMSDRPILRWVTHMYRQHRNIL